MAQEKKQLDQQGSKRIMNRSLEYNLLHQHSKHLGNPTQFVRKRLTILCSTVTVIFTFVLLFL